MEAVAVKHFYFVVFCKTPDCKSIYPLRYLGQQSEAALVMDSLGFHMTCEKCHRRNFYKRDDITIIELPDAPPANWKDRV